MRFPFPSGLLVGLLTCCQSLWVQGESLTPHLFFEPGPINAVWIQAGDQRIFVYRGAAEAWQAGKSSLLLPHGRRDLIAGVTKWDAPVALIAPEKDRPWLETPSTWWEAFATGRFHDYGQQTTKVGIKQIPVTRWVEDGTELKWPGLTMKVLETPGYTRGSVSYLCQVDGKQIALTGDLIYAEGKLLDLYSLQDAIEEARVGGYHGYAGRLGSLISSLEMIRDASPDWLIPARGPIIKNPSEAIDKLIHRVREVYRNYLSTNALHWYFKSERMRICGEKVLGDTAMELELMPYARHIETPDWIRGFSTSRLILAKDGAAFLLDCGYQSVIDEVNKLLESGLIERVEGIFVTHFHDDHSDMVQKASEQFGCPVYATTEYADVLAHPEAYHLPAMTSNPIPKVLGMQDGDRLKWHEYDFTFHFYPGQTFYHGALWVEKEGHDPIFMVGDSFAPSGMDDYCLMNRNLMRDGTGYLLCLEKLRRAKGPFWLINEHIPYLFQFSEQELDYMESRYRQRLKILSDLFPWDDPNYGIDEQWAVFYPYGTTGKTQSKKTFSVKITNHSPTPRQFTITPKGWDGLKVAQLREGTQSLSVSIAPHQTRSIPLTVTLPSLPGQYLLTADIHSQGMAFEDWTEAMVWVE